ncbi:P-loop containing nucleoside triphosphate hydrolase protein [Hypoxylon sp. NC1633]|nr:P-loop containing nucleoside triphosphate hydrolase protein [Hypoxylon sp. NC1633]
MKLRKPKQHFEDESWELEQLSHDSIGENTRFDKHQSELEQENESLRRALEKSQEELQSTRNDLDIIREELAGLQQTLAYITDLEVAFETLEVESQNSIETIKGLREEIKGHIWEKETINTTLTTRNLEIDKLTTNLETATQENVAYAKALEEAEERLKLQERELGLAALDTIRELRHSLENGEHTRSLLHEELQSLRGAIRVICRIRPVDKESELLEYTTEKGVYHHNPAKLLVTEYVQNVRGTQEITSTYDFERIFLPAESNSDVFSGIENFVQSAIDGKNACIFCYGQSGTGKTYTMNNLDMTDDREQGVDYENDGIMPRVKTMIFRERKRLGDLGIGINIEGCCYEIYNNELFLLEPDGRVKRTISKQTRSVIHPELTTLKEDDDFDTLVEVGMRSRHFGATKLNDTSSRSHFIISLEITRGTWGDTHKSTLNLVDLAGSERTDVAGTAGARFQEGSNINTSLSALQRVFASLAQGRQPTYNGNMLTELLQRSLGLNCQTLMLVMITPLKSQWSATKATLQNALNAQSAKRTAQSSRGSRPGSETTQSGRQPGASQRPGVKK